LIIKVRYRIALPACGFECHQKWDLDWLQWSPHTGATLIMRGIGLIIATMLLVSAQVTTDAPLELTCGGGGSANHIDTTTAYAGDSNGHSGWATVNRRRSEGFADQVDLVVDTERSRIRLPRTMLPPIHGGDAGWFKLKDVRVTDTTITGTAAVNPLNSPKVYVDRRTGTISIDGKAGHYTGQCERSVPAGQSTKF
jgi:hypothetical protein